MFKDLECEQISVYCILSNTYVVLEMSHHEISLNPEIFYALLNISIISEIIKQKKYTKSLLKIYFF